MRRGEGDRAPIDGAPATTAGDVTAERPDDEMFGRALRKGDPAGAEGLYKRYRTELHDVTRRIIRDPTRAEDAVQTTFVVAIERAATLRNPAHVKPWLYAIAVNVARQMVGRGLKCDDNDVPETLETEEPGPEAVAVQHDTQRLVRSAMDGLEPRQRVALDLTVRHGLSTNELGQVLGLATPHAAVVLHRAHSALRHSVRALLIAQSRTHCDALAAIVPRGVTRLTPMQRRRVEHHLRHCTTCHARAAMLTSPVELLGGIALLPLPARLGTDWSRQTPHAASPAQLTAARRGFGPWRWRTLIAGGLGIVLFGGGLGLTILHNAHGDQPPTKRPVANVAATPSAVPSAEPTPTPTDLPTATAPPSGAAEWAAAQDFVRQAHQYHVRWSAQSINQSADPRQPSILDLTIQPNGDVAGTYTAVGGLIGDFQLRRVAGVLAVRNINLFGNFGAAGAPMDAIQFFGLTSNQVNTLGSSWLPLTAPAQQPAARWISTAIAPYVDPHRLADGPLGPPPPQTFNGDAYGGPGVETVIDGPATLSFSPGGSAYVELDTPTAMLRIDQFSGSTAVNVVP